jgi:hypothetical protein
VTQSGPLAKFIGGYSMVIEDVSAVNASSVGSTAGVVGIRVKGTASEITQHFDQLVALGDKVQEVQVSDDNDIVISSAQASAGADLIERILGEHSIVVS